MKTNISSAARKIARRHNAKLSSGMGGNGKLVFAPDGSGGAWHSENSYGFGDDRIVVWMRNEKLTGADAQEIIDNA